MEEYYEQLANLQKENLYLKQRMKNIELQTKLEELKKERDVKQELLCQAASDMSLMQKEHQKQREMFQNRIREMEKTKLEELKKERDVKIELLCQAASAVSLMQKEHQEQREMLENRIREMEKEHQEQREMLENRIREMEKELSKSLEQSLSQGLVKYENVSDQTVDTSKDSGIEQLKEHISHLEEELSSLKTRCNCRSSGQVSETTLPCDPVPNEVKSEAKLPAPCNDSESASQSDLLVERLHDVTGKLNELEEKYKVSQKKLSEYKNRFKNAYVALKTLK